MNNLLRSALFAAGVLAGLVGFARADAIPSPAEDLLSQANGGVAAQSSTAWSAPADRGNDGNRAGDFFVDMSVTHTGPMSGPPTELPWLEVTIPAATTIGDVIVWNRTDCCQFRINPFVISIFNGADKVFTTADTGLTDVFNETIVIPNPNPDNSGASGYEIPIDPPVVGDRVRIELVGDLTVRTDLFLHIAELEAYVMPPPPP